MTTSAAEQLADGMTTGGEALVGALAEAGVEVAFGLPGVHNLAAWRAFPGSGIRLIGVRHEQTAAYAADGYARATGRLGVALTTTGPGAANAVAATGEAWASGSPVLVIATDIPTTMRVPGRYRGGLHETTDQAGFFRPVTKACLRVETVEQIGPRVAEAVATATSHPRRPVYLEIPTDLLSAELDPAAAPRWSQTVAASSDATASSGATSSSGAPTSDGLQEAVSRIAAARRPLLWAGGGATAAQASEQVDLLARRLGAPVLTSYGGRGILPPDHPHLVGLPPHVPAGGDLWDAADVVVVLGSDLDAMNTQGFRQPDRPAVVVDLDTDRVQAGEDAITLCSDVRTGATAVLDALDETPREPWWARDETAWPALTDEFGAEVAFLRQLEAGLDGAARAGGDAPVVVADMCKAGYWYAAFGRVEAPRGLAYAIGWGTLGFAFPAALGSCLSGRPTVALVGDGGLLFAVGELATAAQERLPVTVVVVDDGGYGMLAYDFTSHGQTPVGCDLQPPDFAALAAAFRVPAERVEVTGLGDAVAAGIASGGPNLVWVQADLQPPPSSSPRWYRVTR